MSQTEYIREYIVAAERERKPIRYELRKDQRDKILGRKLNHISDSDFGVSNQQIRRFLIFASQERLSNVRYELENSWVKEDREKKYDRADSHPDFSDGFMFFWLSRENGEHKKASEKNELVKLQRNQLPSQVNFIPSAH
ncbi:hypothetical protein BCON_0223g00020 [Botryotinia convoluta]|uniref:Uncharacterized protein n=1 Tax=Botryotinia convoluta TaxID=54673 RepID=A0A4Z1HIZ3_9HELO|nr:hypothetical protein BCON_0223g00020 [Botryotinia convoluta]